MEPTSGVESARLDDAGVLGAADARSLRQNGWKVRDALSFSQDLDAYRSYIAGSLGEFFWIETGRLTEVLKEAGFTNVRRAAADRAMAQSTA